MNKSFVRAALAAALLSTTVAGAMTITATAAVAADNTGKVGQAVGKPLAVAQKAMAAKDFQTALTAAQQAQAIPDQTPYETYVINKFLSIIYVGLKDYPNATTAVEAAADSPAMPDEDKQEILHNAVLLAMQANQYQKIIGYGQQLEQIKGMDDATLTMVAVAFYSLKDNANAQKYAQMAIDAAKAAGKKPEQNALIIVSNLQGKGDPEAARRSLEQLAVNGGDPGDWNKLVNNAFGEKGLANADALNLYRLLFLAGAMQSAEDYNYMGLLAQAQRDSTEAVKVFNAGVSIGKISAADANAKMGKARSAGEADEGILSTVISAAQKSKKGEDGEDAMQVAQDLWGYGRYADVESLVRDAQTKGGAKDPGEIDILLGMAQVAQGKYDAGQATLAQVSGSPGRMRAAHLWSLYAQSKQQAAATPAAH
jgi:hypothetical protein